MQQIAHHPPGKEKNDEGVEEQVVVREAVEPALPREEQLADDQGEEEGDGNDEEIIVVQCLQEMPVQGGVQGTLQPTCRTLRAGQHPPPAHGHETRGAVGIHAVIINGRRQHGGSCQDAEKPLSVRRSHAGDISRRALRPGW